jgi:uncharacterized protein YndB with AHSA1/START domain
MDSSTSAAASNVAERELVITRVFDAPRSLVFKAWTDPEHHVKWMGPEGFTGKVLRSELRPGGAYRFYMRDPKGGDHWQQGIFREVVEPERLVFTYEWANEQGQATRPQTIVTLTFEDQGGKTKLTLKQGIFESVSARDDHRGGWSSSLDCLANYLTTAR